MSNWWDTIKYLYPMFVNSKLDKIPNNLTWLDDLFLKTPD